jgi:hypothetical protein
VTVLAAAGGIFPGGATAIRCLGGRPADGGV